MKWFKHDSDANRNPKLEKVLIKYGADGYALYWLCLELVAGPIDKNHINFEIKHDSEVLAHRLHIDSLRVEEIMRYMVSIELFEADETQSRITCLALAEKIERSIVKNPHMKAIQAAIRAGSILTADLLDHIKSGTIPDDTGKLGLEVDTDIDTDKNTAAATYVGDPKEKEGLMYETWAPSSECVRALGNQGVTLAFIDDYLPDFVLYWIDQGCQHKSWNSLFYQHSLQQWLKM